MASCLVVQHAAPEGPHGFAAALGRLGVELDLRPVFEAAPLPEDLSRHDGLIVMGGPMSATSDLGFPSRAAELALLADALGRELPVLGICLGAQLLAAAAGAEVFLGSAGPEIGWGEIELSASAEVDPLLRGLRSRLRVLHWHGDTFSLPAGATHLASSQRYENQAFRVGRAAWGLQFHLEVDGPAVAAFLEAFGDEASAAGITPSSIEGLTPSSLARLAPVGALVADRFARQLLRQPRGAQAELES